MMELLRSWFKAGDSRARSGAARPMPGAGNLAARAAHWCTLVLRFGMMTSKYASRAARLPAPMAGQHHLAIMLYGASLAERQAARASLRTTIDEYARLLKAQGLTPDEAIRAMIAITREPGVAASGIQSGGEVLIGALGDDMTRWCREAYAGSIRGVRSRFSTVQLSRGIRGQ